MNRFKFTTETIANYIEDLKNNIRLRPFIRKFKPTVKAGKLFVENKEIVPASKVNVTLDEITQNSDAPLGIHSMYAWILNNYIGISRDNIRDYLKKDPVYQKIERRPNTDKPTRKRVKEGKTNKILFRYPNTLGVDLIQIGSQWLPKKYTGETEYLLVCVHKLSGYTFAKLMRKKTAAVTRKFMKKILEDAREKFGKIEHVEQDNGLEFEGAFREYLGQQGVKQSILKKVSYVEKKNSILQRYITMISSTHPFYAAVRISVEKLNNSPNRTNNNKTPKSFIGVKNTKQFIKNKKFKTYKGIAQKARTFKVGDNVRYVMKSQDKDSSGINYKSYKAKHWSKDVHQVLKKRLNLYKLNKVPYWVSSDQIKLYHPIRYAPKKKAKSPKKPASPKKRGRPKLGIRKPSRMLGARQRRKPKHLR